MLVIPSLPAVRSHTREFEAPLPLISTSDVRNRDVGFVRTTLTD